MRSKAKISSSTGVSHARPPPSLVIATVSRYDESRRKFIIRQKVCEDDLLTAIPAVDERNVVALDNNNNNNNDSTLDNHLNSTATATATATATEIATTTTATNTNPNTNPNNPNNIANNAIVKKKRWSFPLRRGGTLQFYRHLVSMDTCTAIQQEIDTKASFRQYRIRNHLEPRLHLLLSWKATGYVYHGVKMKAQPITSMPRIETIATDLARRFGIPRDGDDDNDNDNDLWNIGVDVLLYRDDNDSIGWHADDTQGESLILSLTIGTPQDPRRIRIRPKPPYQDGDEYIELFPRAGDAYLMDGIMQQGYEHSVPARTRSSKEKKKNNNNDDDNGNTNVNVGSNKRYALIFRTGRQVIVDEDSGQVAANTTPRTKPPLIFGAHDMLQEGHLFKRTDLVNWGAHCSDQRGVSGNAQDGCNSIVISRQEDYVRELDHLFTFMYVATTQEGATALFKSFENRRPVRVFRSSRLAAKSPFAAPPSSSSPPPSSAVAAGLSSSAAAAAVAAAAVSSAVAGLTRTTTKHMSSSSSKKTSSSSSAKQTTSAVYRYDGIFMIHDARDRHGRRIHLPLVPPKQQQHKSYSSSSSSSSHKTMGPAVVAGRNDHPMLWNQQQPQQPHHIHHQHHQQQQQQQQHTTTTTTTTTTRRRRPTTSSMVYRFLFIRALPSIDSGNRLNAEQHYYECLRQRSIICQSGFVVAWVTTAATATATAATATTTRTDAATTAVNCTSMLNHRKRTWQVVQEQHQLLQQQQQQYCQLPRLQRRRLRGKHDDDDDDDDDDETYHDVHETYYV